MNDTAENIFNQIGIKQDELKKWKTLKEYNKIENTKVIEKGEPLFMRLNTEEEIDYIKSAMKS